MKRSIFLLVCYALAFSCARHTETEVVPGGAERDIQETASPDSITFTAVLENATRTQLGDGNRVLWSEGDKIKVFNSATPEGLVFTLKSGAGTSSGTFTAPGSGMGDGPFYAVYPSSAVSTMSGTAISVTLPATQTYAAGSFGPAANLAAGKADVLEEIKFMNLLGAISFTLTGEGSVSELRLRAQGSVPLHGAGVIDGWDSEAPAIAWDPGQTADSFRELTLSCHEVALTSEGTTFYLTIPVGTLGEGFTFEVDDTQGGTMQKQASANTDNRIARGDLLQMPALPFAGSYKTAFLLADKIGAYKAVSASSSSSFESCCLYTEGSSQYAFKNVSSGSSPSRMVRIEDWEEGYFLSVTTPYLLEEGTDISGVTVKVAGATGTVTSGAGLSMKVVKKADGRVWLHDPTSDHGYVLMMVED